MVKLTWILTIKTCVLFLFALIKSTLTIINFIFFRRVLVVAILDFGRVVIGATIFHWSDILIILLVLSLLLFMNICPD